MIARDFLTHVLVLKNPKNETDKKRKKRGQYMLTICQEESWLKEQSQITETFLLLFPLQGSPEYQLFFLISFNSFTAIRKKKIRNSN